MAKKEDELLNHDYDGIQEYDNNLPKWWVQLFWVTIIFSVVYVVYYHMMGGLNQEQVLAKEIAEMQQFHASQPKSEGVTEESLLALVSNPAAIQSGAAIFQAKCLACHGPQGQGLVGPNLTDDHWIHGPKLTDMRKIVVEGVAAKGMLSWKGLLTDDEISSVVAYIRTLHGTNPPNPKAPEGNPA